MAIFLLFLLFAAIIAVEVPGLLRKKMFGELWTFGFLTLLAMVLSFGMALQLPVPDINKGIAAVVRPVQGVIVDLLGPQVGRN